MGKTLKRSLIVGIIFLFISTTCIPVLASEEKPDLIVEQIGRAWDNQFNDLVYATIRNIGTEKAEGDIYVKYTVIRLLFGVIPIKVAQTGTKSVYRDGGLKPGDFLGFTLSMERDLPKFGIFRVSATVNPGEIIEESNYDNNDLSQKFIAFLGQWN